jgi:hypothetical protein
LLLQPAEGAPAGPLIGVFIHESGRMPYQPGSASYGAVEGVYRQARAFLYYFYLNDIDYDRRLISAVYFDRVARGWRKALFPYPDTVYLRSGVPERRDREFVLMQKAFKELQVPAVNSLVGFDKWEVYRVLEEDAALRPHLPETRLYQSKGKELELMLRAYGRVYLKGCRGRRGRQVMRVTRLAGGRYEYRCFVDKLIRRTVNSRAGLCRAVESFFQGRPFVIQQAIDLLEHEGRLVDLRAEMQRDGKGELAVVAVPVRVALPDSPITTHASSYRFDYFFAGLAGYSEAALAELQDRVHDLLFAIYRCIEKRYGHFGEIGIDLGLDKSGRLWFIECNSQPARVSLTKAYGGETAMAAFANPLAYALYLCKST